MLLGVFMLAATPESEAKKAPQRGPDYGSINVPEEGTIRFERLTTDNDCVSYKRVGKNRTKPLNKREDLLKMDWWANPQIAVSPDGSKIAYINQKTKPTTSWSSLHLPAAPAFNAHSAQTFSTFLGVRTETRYVSPNTATDISAYTLSMPLRET